ncbi:uncharacterized protein [Prorops nasuta]|uniref:uncharacterized protein n=1 Tax=Prorops nasuta TaxID=863751 RepID=UPI0034CFC03C
MKRGAKCIVQTINLSNPRTCVRPKIGKSATSSDLKVKACIREASVQQARWTPRPVTVKLCTRQQVERRTCPKFRAGGKEEAKKNRFGRTMFLILNGAICAGLLYWSFTEGYLSPDEWYRKILCIIYPDVFKDEETKRFESLRKLKRKLVQTYNQVVMDIFDAIVSIPSEIHKSIRDIVYSPSDQGGDEGEGSEIDLATESHKGPMVKPKPYDICKDLPTFR